MGAAKYRRRRARAATRWHSHSRNDIDALGYEAHPARHGDEWQIEAFNCVFHALAQKFPRVCTFVLAYVESATQRRIHHLECFMRGARCVGSASAKRSSTAANETRVRDQFLSRVVFMLRKSIS